ncbi:MAG: hypothetical protein JWO93_91 [Micrococcaceae bacterium]|nr:hypothetical protein [Micrococcaceae bacterium]
MGKKIGTGSNAMLNAISGCATEPDGVSLVDPEQGDTRVANWAARWQRWGMCPGTSFANEV